MDQLLQGLLGKDREAILNWVPDFSSVDKAELDKHIEEAWYAKEKKTQLDLWEEMGLLFEDFDPNCKLNVRGVFHDLASLELNIEGQGYG